MLKKYRQKIESGLLAALAIIGFIFVAAPVSAQGSYNFATDSGIQNTANIGGYVTDEDADTQVNETISNIILIFISFVGVIFFVLVLYGGITWMTASGNNEKTEQATKIIMGSMVGLIITLSAYVVSSFLINHFWK